MLVLSSLLKLSVSAAGLTKTFEELVDSTLLCVWQLLQILIHPLLKQTCHRDNTRVICVLENKSVFQEGTI